MGALNLNEIEVNDLTQHEEAILKNNFYMRLEIVARGRYLYEMNPVDNTAVPYNLLGSNSNISLNSKDFKR